MLQIMSRSGYRMQLQLYLILPNTTQSPNVTRLIQIFDTYLRKHIVVVSLLIIAVPLKWWVHRSRASGDIWVNKDIWIRSIYAKQDWRVRLVWNEENSLIFYMKTDFAVAPKSWRVSCLYSMSPNNPLNSPWTMKYCRGSHHVEHNLY